MGVNESVMRLIDEVNAQHARIVSRHGHLRSGDQIAGTVTSYINARFKQMNNITKQAENKSSPVGGIGRDILGHVDDGPKSTNLSGGAVALVGIKTGMRPKHLKESQMSNINALVVDQLIYVPEEGVEDGKKAADRIKSMIGKSERRVDGKTFDQRLSDQKKEKDAKDEADKINRDSKVSTAKKVGGVGAAIGAVAGGIGAAAHHVKQKSLAAEAARKAAEAAEKAKETAKHTGIGSAIMQKVKENPKAAAAVAGGSALLGAGLAARKFLKARKKAA